MSTEKVKIRRSIEVNGFGLPWTPEQAEREGCLFWQCPRCERCIATHIDYCPHCPPPRKER